MKLLDMVRWCVAMASLEEAVNWHLETDVTMADGLVRGIVEPRRAAQWFASEKEWKEPEEAIMQSMKLWLEDRHEGLMAREREALQKYRYRIYPPCTPVKVPEGNIPEVDYERFHILGQFGVGEDHFFLVPSRSASSFSSSVSGVERENGSMIGYRVPEGLSVLPVAVRLMRLALHRDVDVVGLRMSARNVDMWYRDGDSRFVASAGCIYTP